jgi:hypothetical protein
MPETQLIYDQDHAYGMFLKGMSDAQVPEKGATELDSITEKIWDKRVQRYRYTRGMRTLAGKRMGGKFASAPPGQRKKPY